ncbi:hypothetical protein HYDPIDRAFT_31504 [Hydnomerulius pinastri MD-312]|uniref:Nucleotide exchange factor Fes1 domain-containing protein n=1 Tax=Hydnomerulius pinastri MD-312 TaxID=994086 RepID=A0A0C9WBI2_9AGAM|nr:hypothetical protein HYDPIDRAFT_31504 [Hydnomerulius pinastri MD-312]
MESLLRWGIENSAPSGGDAPPPAPRKDLDPAIIDHILGKPDAQLMKEALEVAVDETKDGATRIAAMDDLEMACGFILRPDLKKLNMWEPIHGLLGLPTTTDGLKVQTLWVLGTALQNNPAAQLAYLSLDPLPGILSCLSPPSNSAEARAKAMYALSGLLKHNAAAVAGLRSADGWNALRTSLEDSDISVRRKTAFLLNTLLVPTSDERLHTPDAVHTPSSSSAPVHPNSHASMLSDPSSTSTSAMTMEALQCESAPEGSSLLDAFISALVEPVPFGPDGESEKDVEFQENIVRLLYTYSAQCRGAFSAAQRHSLRTFLNAITPADDLFSLTTEEFVALKGAVA